MKRGNELKKYLLLIATLMLLAACTEEKPETKAVSTTEETAKTDEPTQEELNKEVKATAKAITFVAANGDEVAKDERVTIIGKISSITSKDVGGSFVVTTTEGDGHGMYNIVNLTLEDIKDGQEVTLYGTYNGKDATGIPEIVATIIE